MVAWGVFASIGLTLDPFGKCGFRIVCQESRLGHEYQKGVCPRGHIEVVRRFHSRAWIFGVCLSGRDGLRTITS